MDVNNKDYAAFYSSIIGKIRTSCKWAQRECAMNGYLCCKLPSNGRRCDVEDYIGPRRRAAILCSFWWKYNHSQHWIMLLKKTRMLSKVILQSNKDLSSSSQKLINLLTWWCDERTSKTPYFPTFVSINYTRHHRNGGSKECLKYSLHLIVFASQAFWLYNRVFEGFFLPCFGVCVLYSYWTFFLTSYCSG